MGGDAKLSWQGKREEEGAIKYYRWRTDTGSIGCQVCNKRLIKSGHGGMDDNIY